MDQLIGEMDDVEALRQNMDQLIAEMDDVEPFHRILEDLPDADA